MEDRISFAQVLDQLACRLDGGSVEYLAHWITPERAPRRYDTRFFAAKVPVGSTPIVDPREMSDALASSPLMPNEVIQMVQSGEKAGRLGEVFERVAEFTEAEFDQAIKDFTPLIEPLMIVVMAAVGGFVAIAMLMPIFSVGSVVASG